MYKQKTENFGGFEKITLYNDNGISFSVIPGYGANVNEIKLPFNGRSFSVIDGVASAEELLSDKAFKSCVLLPWPNRMEDGRYEFEGKSYQVEINETDRNTALHGFIYRKEFDVEDIVLHESGAEIKLTCIYNGEESGYPFHFQVNLTYSISTENGFAVKVEIVNTDSCSIPMGFGWHPYIKLPSMIDELRLQMPRRHVYDVNSRLLPTGKTSEAPDFTVSEKIGIASLDTCFKVIEDSQIAATLVRDEAAGFELKFWQETGPEGFDFLQVYTPATRQTIALEPMTCGVNAFNNRDGLLIMKPGERFIARFGINLLG